MIRRMITALILALTPLAAAQPIADLLPAETLLALGTTGLDQHADLLDVFLTEFDERGVGDALVELFGDLEGDMAEGAPGIEAGVPAALQGLEPLDVIGQDAWIAISAAPFNPLPVLTLAARMSPEATLAFGGVMAEAVEQGGAQEFSESGVAFWVTTIQEPESPVQVLAFTQHDGVTMLSTNPDVLRGVLRRMTGSDEPGFGTSPAYAATLGQLDEGQFYAFLDLAAVASIAAPYTRGVGFAPQIERIQRALATAGTSAGVIRLDADGIESASVMAPNPDGGDLALYHLLTAEGTYDPLTLQFVPTTALSVTSASTDLAGWWNYLNDLVGSLPELGIQSLDQALMAFLGIDLRTTFFDWTGTHTATITTGVTDVAQPGMTATNLLGEQVYAIEATDEATARAGLSTLFNNISASVAAFADPSGGAGGAEIAQQTIAGVTVETYQITPGIQIATAVVDGYALIATSLSAMEAALTAATTEAGLSPVFAPLLADLPLDAKAISLSDSRALMEASALQLASMIQLGSGFAGGGNLDFDAITQASEVVEDYLLFIASRLGGSVSYTEVVDGVVVSEGRTAIGW